MTWDRKPSADEVAQWFSKVPLHDGMEHDRYIGGIVAIENTQTKQWNAYATVAARVAYFWDWCLHNQFNGEVMSGDPFEQPLMFAKEKTAQSLAVQAVVTVRDGEDVVRRATGQKQVDMGWKMRKTGDRFPDLTALMKAETGAVGRALGNLGMLTLPGSGVASADDIYEYLRQEREAEDDGVASAQQGKSEPRADRRAPNPKRASGGD